MAINKKTIFKNAFIVYSRLILTMLVAIFSSRILLEGLGIDGHGLYSLVTGFVAAIGIINSIMVTASNRFIAIEIGKEISVDAVKYVFSLSLTLHLFLGIILLIFGKILGYFWIEYYLNVDYQKLNDAHIIFNTSLAILFCNVLSVPFIALVNAKEDFKFQSNTSFIQSIVLLGLAYSVNYFSLNVVNYAVLAAIAYIIYFIANSFYSIVKFEEVSVRLNFDKILMREMFSYSGWMSIGAFSYMFKNQGNAIVINNYFGTLYNSSFAIATQVYNQINNLTITLNKVFLPQLLKSFGKNEKNEQLEMGFLSSRYLFIISCFLGFPFLLFAKEILDLWLIEIPPSTSILLQLMIIDLILSMSNNGLGNLIFATGKVRDYQIFTNLIGLFSLPITIFLFVMGAPVYFSIMISIIMTFFVNISKVRFARRYFDFSFKDLFEYNLKYQLRLVGGLIVVMIFNVFLKEEVSLVFRFILANLLAIFFCFYFGFTQKEKNNIYKKIKK